MSAVVIATSLAASSAAISASNSARIAQQKKEECVLFVEGFDSRSSNLVQQKHYASCVQLLNPEPMTANETTGAKVCIVAMLVALIIGLVVGWKDDGLFGAIMFGLLFPLGLAIIGIIVLVIFSGLVFLFA